MSLSKEKRMNWMDGMEGVVGEKKLSHERRGGGRGGGGGPGCACGGGGGGEEG